MFMLLLFKILLLSAKSDPESNGVLKGNIPQIFRPVNFLIKICLEAFK